MKRNNSSAVISSSALVMLTLVLSGCVAEESTPSDVGETQEPLLVSTHGIHGVAGKCLDVMWGDMSDGNGVWLWDCNNTDAQAWTLMPSGEIRTSSGKCLAVAGGNTADGTSVVIWPCLGYADQKWTVGPDNTLRGIGGKCLTVASTGDTGAVAHIETCTSNAGQKWTFPWSTILKNPDYNVCMYTNGNAYGQIGSGSTILWADCADYGVANRYIFLPTGEIQTTNGLCLDVKNASTDEGATIQAYTCTGGSNQKWKYDQTTGGIQGLGGKCIGITSGTNVLSMHTCYYGSSQNWRPLIQP